MKKLSINGRHIMGLPGKWEELTPDQVSILCKLMRLTESPLELKLLLLLNITKITVCKNQPASRRHYAREDREIYLKHKGKIFLAHAQDVDAMMAPLDFLIAYTQEGQPYINSGLYFNHFKQLRTRLGQKLYGPDSALYNINMDEFIRIVSLKSLMGKKGADTSALTDKICGILYRKKDRSQNPNCPSFSGDLRQPFNDHLVDGYAKTARWLSPWQKNYIILFLDGSLRFLSQKHPEAFMDPEQGSSPTPTSTFEAFTKVVNMLCQKDPTQAAAIRKSPLYDVMPQINQYAIEGRQLKKHATKTR